MYVREWKMSLVIANIPATLPSCELGSKSNVLSWFALPYGTHQPYCIPKFCKEKGEDPPQILLRVQALPPITHKHAGKVWAGHRVSPPALWGVPVLRHDIWSLQSQQLLPAQRESCLLLPTSPRVGSMHPTTPAGVRRAPLRMRGQSWLSLNESCFVWSTLPSSGISLCLRGN